MTWLLNWLGFARRNLRWVLLAMAVLTVLGGWWVYSCCYGGTLSWYQSLYYAFALFALDVKQPVEIGIGTLQAQEWHLIYIPAFFGLITTIGSVLGFAAEIFKERIEAWQIETLKRQPHTLVIGLGENNRMYLKSEIDETSQRPKHAIIVIEPDRSNPYIGYFRSMGFGHFRNTVGKFEFAFDKLERVIISTGNDLKNIEIALQILRKGRDENDKHSDEARTTTLHIHLDNHDYRALFHQRFFENKEALESFEIKPYSFYDSVARDLWMKHPVLGNFSQVAKECTMWHIALVGDGDLAGRVLYYLIPQTVLPHDKPVTIHLICADPRRFLEKFRSDYVGVDDIGHVTFECHPLTMDSPEFVREGPWRKPYLTHIVACFDEDDKNLECAVNLYDKVFLEEAIRGKMKTKVLIALFQNSKSGDVFTQNEKRFKEFNSFGYA
ncbi:hypothetical protein, partial [Hydrogenimonas sp.]|uniref:hypothetical protein n=1 Tax=Hydrogenimonas sp. TaxID=2231112 RepID=UPI0026100359